MEIYSADQVKTIHQETFAYLIVEEMENVLTLTLNRENKRNALHPQLVNEIAYAFQYAHFSVGCCTPG